MKARTKGGDAPPIGGTTVSSPEENGMAFGLEASKTPFQGRRS